MEKPGDLQQRFSGGEDRESRQKEPFRKNTRRSERGSILKEQGLTDGEDREAFCLGIVRERIVLQRKHLYLTGFCGGAVDIGNVV